MNPPHKYRCPSCDQKSGVNIVYGYPCDDMALSAERGEIVLGGCCIDLEGPERQCMRCEATWRIKRRTVPDIEPATPSALTVIEALRTELAVLQEAVQRIEIHESPILTARYLATLGEREYKLLQLQVDVRAYRRRIEQAQAICNHGHKLDSRAVAEIDASVNSELQEWHTTLKQREQALVLAQFNLTMMQFLPDEQVQRAKQAYRQLARWLHPDAHPENAALFARFWPAVQAAYQAYHVDELETLVQVIARELPVVPTMADDEALAQRLKELIAVQARQLADLQAEPPMCYRTQLDDAAWVARRCAELDLAIHHEAAQLAALVGRFADLTAASNPQ